MNKPLPQHDPNHLQKMHEAFLESCKAKAEPRFWAKVEQLGKDDCWIFNHWVPKPPQMYPYVTCRSIRRTPMPAHRAAFYFHYGYNPKEHVLHKCGNHGCCNPHHLYAGTPKQNHEDSVRHGTFKPLPHRQGEAVHNAKLTVELVILIRHVWPLLKRQDKRTFANLLGMSQTNIRRVLNRKVWGHVQGTV